ncbi:MAG: DUF2254 domain-containing protein [Pseudomonadota bacterium]
MYLPRPLFTLRRALRQVWLRIVAILALAFLAAAVTPLLSILMPDGVRDRFDEEAISALLSILTGTMLGVATFSLSVMVAAHHYAASQVTPRSHRLLREDGRTQSVLATFVGAFAYALASVVLINAGLYGPRDYAVAYIVTVAVVGFVIVALVRWIQHLVGLGSVEATTKRVEDATETALQDRGAAPSLGAVPSEGEVPSDSVPVLASGHGYVLHLDTAALDALAERLAGIAHVAVQPGDWVSAGDALVHLTVPRLSVADMHEAEDAVLLSDIRSYDQDPEFGLQVMSEIAQRALSPGLNDPRTAIDVIQRQMRLLLDWSDASDPGEARFRHVRVPPLDRVRLVETAFDCIARDGAALVEIQLAVQNAMTRLSGHSDPQIAHAACHVARRALTRSDENLDLAEDRARVRDAANAAHAKGAEPTRTVPDRRTGT